MSFSTLITSIEKQLCTQDWKEFKCISKFFYSYSNQNMKMRRENHRKKCEICYVVKTHQMQRNDLKLKNQVYIFPYLFKNGLLFYPRFIRANLDIHFHIIVSANRLHCLQEILNFKNLSIHHFERLQFPSIYNRIYEYVDNLIQTRKGKIAIMYSILLNSINRS